MIHLKYGHIGPKVVSLQILLNRHTPTIALNVDGMFGPKTKSGVIAFQRHYKLSTDAVVGKKTWGKLRQLSGLETVDMVDMTSNDLGGAVADIKSAGGNPIIMRGMSNGVGQAMVSVAQQVKGAESIVLLRLYAHGAPGGINVSAGVDDYDADLAGISNSNFHQIRGSLNFIKGKFAPFSSVGFHGCQVGRGSAGRNLVRKLADVWQVPVTAAVRYQLVGGGARYTFRHEGPVFTAYPGGVSLRSWARQVAHHGEIKVQSATNRYF